MIAAILRRLAVAGIRPALSPLNSKSPLVRRLVFDSLPAGYVVTGGRERYVVDSRDRVIGRAVFVGGDFEFSKVERAFAILAARGIRVRRFVDVGANIGTVIVPVLARGMADEGVAIEPHPDNARLLRANLAMNGLDAVVHVCAVGDKSGMAMMVECQDNSGDHQVGDGSLPVPCVRLDDLIQPGDGTLLWMDVQGYEGFALEGAARLIESGTPMVVEFAPAHLDKAGGYSSFVKVLAGREIIDLDSESRIDSIDALRVAMKSNHTDLLLL